MRPVFRFEIERALRRAAAVVLAAALSLTLPLSAPVAGTPAETLIRHGMTIELFVDFARFRLSREEIVAWIDVAVDGLHAYYGRLPIDRVKLRIESFAGRGVGSATTFGNPSPRIEFKLGTKTELPDLMDDWKMTHEFLHLTVPKLSRSQTWLDESIEGGLDDTRRWGTTYWGGALFCLLADIDIRQATGNRKGLREAHASLVERGRVIGEPGNAAELFREADEALGVGALSALYTRLRLRPFEVEPAKLFEDLGVALIDGAVVFNDDAPMAGIRRAITRN